MNLADLVARYALEHDIAPATVAHLSDAVKSLDAWRGQTTLVADLSDDLVNAWINARLKAGKSRSTVRCQRTAILTLWRSAHAAGLLVNEPKRVKVVKAPLPNPDAWWPDETARLLAAAERAEGVFPCGAKRAPLLTAWLLVGYYTCLRPCDIRKLSWSDLRPDGMLVIVQQKTGETVYRYLPEDAMEALKAIRGESEAMFPVRKKTLYYWWSWLKREAKVPGSLKWLRRTGATACEIQQPGSAMQALGHKTAGLAYKHYVDRRQTSAKPVTPPRITRP